jgi:hypothetical protein
MTIPASAFKAMATEWAKSQARDMGTAGYSSVAVTILGIAVVLAKKGKMSEGEFLGEVTKEWEG